MGSKVQRVSATMGQQVNPSLGRGLRQSPALSRSATAGEYALPEDDAAEAAISQQCYQSSVSSLVGVAGVTPFLVRVAPVGHSLLFAAGA